MSAPVRSTASDCAGAGAGVVAGVGAGAGAGAGAPFFCPPAFAQSRLSLPDSISASQCVRSKWVARRYVVQERPSRCVGRAVMVFAVVAAATPPILAGNGMCGYGQLAAFFEPISKVVTFEKPLGEKPQVFLL